MLPGPPYWQVLVPECPFAVSFLNPAVPEIRRRRLIVGGLSVLLTAIVMTGFLVESRWGYSPPATRLIYMQSWRADRSSADALADRQATEAAQQRRLAEARAVIATLSGDARVKAQEQYDRYVAGGGVRKDIPYVPAASAGAPGQPPLAEPLVE